MTAIKLNIRLSLEKNAARYFENAKKLRAKLDGIKQTIDKFTQQLTTLETQQTVVIEQQRKKAAQPPREKKWHEKFHWFISSEGFLCVGGRDATSNEIIVKKHTEKDDLLFHTEAAGSPFFVIKAAEKKIGEQTIAECAQATASYSRAWKQGMATTDVYWVLPSQVSKQTESGEFVAKGAFIIRGKKNPVSVELKLAVGITSEGIIMGGPPAAITKNCVQSVIVQQGDISTSDAAKKIKHTLGAGELNDIIAVLPAGGCRIIVGTFK